MRIAIDVQTIGRQRGGDETYYRNLLKQYAAQDSGDDYSLFYTNASAEPFLRSLGPRFSARKLAQGSPWLRIPFAAPMELRRTNADVYHTQYVGVRPPSVKLVLTVHDLSYEIYPRSFPLNRAFFLKGTRWSAKLADRVIAVSESTKRDLMKFYRLPEEKITVIHNGVDASFSPHISQGALARVRKEYDLKKPYLLAIGSAHPRKNTDRLIDALDAVNRGRAEGVQLIFTGSLAADVMKRAAARDDVRVLGHVPDEDLPALYRCANGFVYPSLYEGFGLPVLEAMACGTPVACSNVSSIPEIAGDAACFFSPTDVASMVKAIKTLLVDENGRRQLSEKGLERSAIFSWEKTARQTAAVYQSVLEGAMA